MRTQHNIQIDIPHPRPTPTELPVYSTSAIHWSVPPYPDHTNNQPTRPPSCTMLIMLGIAAMITQHNIYVGIPHPPRTRTSCLYTAPPPLLGVKAEPSHEGDLSTSSELPHHIQFSLHTDGGHAPQVGNTIYSDAPTCLGPRHRTGPR